MKKRIAVWLEQELLNQLRQEVTRRQIAQSKGRDEINFSTVITEAIEKLLAAGKK